MHRQTSSPSASCMCPNELRNGSPPADRSLCRDERRRRRLPPGLQQTPPPLEHPLKALLCRIPEPPQALVLPLDPLGLSDDRLSPPLDIRLFGPLCSRLVELLCWMCSIVLRRSSSSRSSGGGRRGRGGGARTEAERSGGAEVEARVLTTRRTASSSRSRSDRRMGEGGALMMMGMMVGGMGGVQEMGGIGTGDRLEGRVPLNEQSLLHPRQRSRRSVRRTLASRMLLLLLPILIRSRRIRGGGGRRRWEGGVEEDGRFDEFGDDGMAGRREPTCYMNGGGVMVVRS